MKHIYIHAFAAANLGDDLMMHILCTRYPKVRFRLYADNSYKARFKDLANLKVYSPSDSWVIRIDRILNKIKRTDRGFWKFLIKTSDATVHIGGSVFTQHETDYFPALNLDAQLARLSKKIYVIGANFGPYVDKKYECDYQSLFRGYEDICFRDQYSLRLHSLLPNVRFAPDVVFNYKHIPSCKEKKQVLISMIYLESRGGKYRISQYANGYYKFILHITRKYIALGYRIVFISFCSYQEDEKAIETVLNLLTEKELSKTSLLVYDQNLTDCVRAFAQSSLVIGTRFHSIILSWLCGKRVLPLVYDQKTLHTLQDNGVEEYLTLDRLEELSEEAAGKMAWQLTQSRPFDAAPLIKQAEGQFAELDKILKEERK